MKILILTINYAPEPTGFAPHVTALSEHLSSQAHTVTVLTGFPFAPYWSRWPAYRGKFIECLPINQVDVVRLSHFIPTQAGKMWQRLLMEGSFCIAAIGFLLTHRDIQPDLILYVGAQPSLAMLARLLAWLWHKPYVVAINDLAAQAAGDVGIIRAHWLQKILEKFEYTAYAQAQGAIVLCDAFKQALMAHQYPAQRIQIIRSPVDLDNIRPLESDGKFRQRHQLSVNDFVVLYAGSMGVKQGLLKVIEAARLLYHKHPSVKWILVGDGEAKSLLAQSITTYGLAAHVRLLPLQPESEMSNMFAAADLLLLNQLKTVKDTVIPSKLLTYMAAGQPVLAAVNASSQGAILLREAQGGMVIEPENPFALAEAVQALLIKKNDSCGMGDRNRRYAEKNFDQRNIVLLQEEFLLKVVQRTKSR